MWSSQSRPAARPAATVGAVDKVVVWGNCQAAPVAQLLRAPMAAAGLEVVDLPPIYLLSDDEVARVHELMADVALLVSQPIRDEYRVPGCSTERLAGLMPSAARLVVFPLTYHNGSFPFQVTATDGSGHRPAAPLTEYHDLRLLAAAARGTDDLETLWTAPGAEAVERRRVASLAELRRREATCDLPVSDLAEPAGSMFTLNHPRNTVLAAVAARVLHAWGRPELAEHIEVPEREFLGAIRTPVDTGDLDADRWIVDKREVGWQEVAAAHRAWYAEHPDVLAHTVERHAPALADLGLLDAG